MQGSLFAVIAVALIIVLLLIWLNIMMVRRGKSKVRSQTNQAEPSGSSKTHQLKTEESLGTDPQSAKTPPAMNDGSLRENKAPTSVPETSASPTHAATSATHAATSATHAATSATHAATSATHAATSAPDGSTGSRRERSKDERNLQEEVAAATKSTREKSQPSVGSHRKTTEQEPAPASKEGNMSSDVQVVSRAASRQGQGTKVFDRNALPYFLHGASVPEFDTEAWHEVFMRLIGDTKVMGWVAFQDDTAGASDREYDYGFLEVLRGYKRSVGNLQREIGLSHVIETSVIGEEGKIWFLTGSEDHHWFALFVERNADVHEIVKPFMRQLISAD